SRFGVVAPANAITGIPFSFTVKAQDQFGNAAPSYSGTVHFTSSDPGANLPANSTQSSGQGVFTATLNLPGTQTVSATDTVATSITGVSNNIAVMGLAVSSLTPNSTGFVAVFNKPFDPSTINLFDTSGSFGADDVALTGPLAPSTSFHGSLL